MMDLRPGGIFHYGLTAPDGKTTMWGRFVYREVVEPSRLIFVVSFSDANGGVTRHPMAAEAAALESFDDPADAGKLIAARRAVDDAKRERAVLAVALEAAEKAHAEAVAHEAARETEARYARLRGKAAAFRESLTAELVTFGKNLAAHEAIVDALPPSERFRFWPPSYCETASRSICTDADRARQGGTRQIDLRLLIPNP